MKLLLLVILTLIPLSVNAEIHSDSSIMENPSEYNLMIDEHSFPVRYQVNSEILAMSIDTELRSLLIGLDNTEESIFVIDLRHEIISAENNEFLILVDGHETEYQLITSSNRSVFSFYVPEFTEEVEIIGTHVIPEFPFGIILIFTVLVAFVVVFSKTNTIFKL